MVGVTLGCWVREEKRAAKEGARGATARSSSGGLLTWGVQVAVALLSRSETQLPRHDESEARLITWMPRRSRIHRRNSRVSASGKFRLSTNRSTYNVRQDPESTHEKSIELMTLIYSSSSNLASYDFTPCVSSNVTWMYFALRTPLRFRNWR